jgi:hypothetical protein
VPRQTCEVSFDKEDNSKVPPENRIDCLPVGGFPGVPFSEFTDETSDSLINRLCTSPRGFHPNAGCGGSFC